MTTRYPLVLNGSQIQELQVGDVLAGSAENSDALKVGSYYRTASVDPIPNTIAARDNQADLYANIFRGIATSAQFADLAEKYISDYEYEEGTVVVFGGEKETTITEKYADTRVAGAISKNPAYIMNSESSGQAVALRGKVPVKIVGTVKKGDLLVTSNVPGFAQVALANFSANAVFAKSLEDKDSEQPGTVVAVII